MVMDNGDRHGLKPDKWSLGSVMYKDNVKKMHLVDPTKSLVSAPLGKSWKVRGQPHM